MTTLEVGEVATLRVRFLNTAGAPTDPTVVSLTYTDPSGNLATVLQAALTNDAAAGVWTYALTVDEAGVWTYRFEGTGAVVAGETQYLLVAAEGASGGLSGPCEDWVTADDVFECGSCASITSADQDWALATLAASGASRVLYLLSGRRYPGICDSTVRPYDCSCGHDRCGCPSVEEIELVPGPVLGIAQVLVDGTAVAATAYEIHDERWLVRSDGLNWPRRQDLSADPTSAVATFQVRFFHGTNPPDDGVQAARLLACEMYQACASGAGSCALPADIQTLTRQGIQIGFEGAEETFSEGRTGIRAVDRFLSTERYAAANLPTAVASPDYGPIQRRVTG